MSNSEQVHERADSPKVQERIVQDGYQAVKKAVEGVRDNLVGKGFKASEIAPLITEGAQDAILDFEE